MARAGVVDQKQMVGARPPLDVDVFADLDRALGAQHDQPSVAPGRQAVRGEPVHPHIAPGTLAAQHDLTKIFEAGRRQFGETAGRAADHLGVFRPGENQELVDLVGADVAQDAAMRVLLEEPGRADRAVQAVRRQIDGLHDAADLTGLDQPQRRGHRGHLEALREADREDAAGFRDDLLQFRQLRQRGHAGLVRHDILAVPHRRRGQRRAIARNGADDDGVDGGILQQGVAIGDFPQIGEPLAEARQHARVGRFRPIAGTCHAGGDQFLGHLVNMTMVEADYGEAGHRIASTWALAGCFVANASTDHGQQDQRADHQQAAGQQEGVVEITGRADKVAGHDRRCYPDQVGCPA